MNGSTKIVMKLKFSLSACTKFMANRWRKCKIEELIIDLKIKRESLTLI